jgi:hypothetical protein
VSYYIACVIDPAAFESHTAICSWKAEGHCLGRSVVMISTARPIRRSRLSTAKGSACHDAEFHRDKLAAMRYFFRYELPKVDAWLGVVASRDPTCREMQDAWF